MSGNTASTVPKRHLAVVVTLLVLVAVSVSLVLFGNAPSAVVFAIAAAQVALILVFLMHLRSEGRLLYVLLFSTIVFLGHLFVFLLLGFHDTTAGAQRVHYNPAAAEQPESESH